jgi:Ring finger domain
MIYVSSSLQYPMLLLLDLSLCVMIASIFRSSGVLTFLLSSFVLRQMLLQVFDHKVVCILQVSLTWIIFYFHDRVTEQRMERLRDIRAELSAIVVVKKTILGQVECFSRRLSVSNCHESHSDDFNKNRTLIQNRAVTSDCVICFDPLIACNSSHMNLSIHRLRPKRTSNIHSTAPSIETIYEAPCHHLFHVNCITKWIQLSKSVHSTSCPVCKQPITHNQVILTCIILRYHPH